MVLLWVLAVCLSGSASKAQAQTPATPDAGTIPGAAGGAKPVARMIWSTVNPREKEIVERLLESDHWPLRVFALLRLERFQGPEVEKLIRDHIRDNAWQVRCFALRQARQCSMTIAPEALKGETEPRVIRAALRAGVKLDEAFVTKGTKKLMRIRGIDELLLGIEIAAASDIEPLRAEARRRVIRILGNLDDSLSIRFSNRLARILDIKKTPRSLDQWRIWYQSVGKSITLSPPVDAQSLAPRPATEIATMEADIFSRLIDYLDFLKQRDLEMVIAMDFTSSMLPMINETRAGVDALILFMSDISRTMRLGFVAYRDHDNTPVFEQHDFTNQVASVRDFLFNVRVTGGADFPEAVLDGLTACAGYDWSRSASSQIILVGDAPPHERDMYQLMNLLESLQNREITVHAVHVPLKRGVYPMPESWFIKFNSQTEKTFAQIAERGGGRQITLNESEALVLSIMHFTLEEGWWPVFDEFYGLYLEICR